MESQVCCGASHVLGFSGVTLCTLTKILKAKKINPSASTFYSKVDNKENMQSLMYKNARIVQWLSERFIVV